MSANNEAPCMYLNVYNLKKSWQKAQIQIINSKWKQDKNLILMFHPKGKKWIKQDWCILISPGDASQQPINDLHWKMNKEIASCWQRDGRTGVSLAQPSRLNGCFAVWKFKDIKKNQPW